MHRIIQTEKAKKMQANLHMIDLPKQNDRILFVSSLNEIKKKPAH